MSYKYPKHFVTASEGDLRGTYRSFDFAVFKIHAITPPNKPFNKLISLTYYYEILSLDLMEGKGKKHTLQPLKNKG